MPRLLHMSALGADPDGPSPLPAQQGRSRGDGRGVRTALDDLPAVGDLRPRGHASSTCSRGFARCCRSWRSRRRTRGSSRSTSATSRTASCSAIDDEITLGGRYDLCGPKVYTLRELVRYVGRSDRRGAADLRARARAVEAAGDACSSICPGKLMTPRQPRVDAEGQRLRLSRSRRCSASRRRRSSRSRLQYLAPRGAAQPVRPLSRASSGALSSRSAGRMARALPQPVRVYPRRRLGARRAARPPGRRSRLRRRRRDARDDARVGLSGRSAATSRCSCIPIRSEEYALARTERKHGRGYRGFEFFASPDVTLEEDLRAAT